MRRDEDEAVDIGQALEGLTRAVRDLGTAGAATPFGAIEAHAMMIEQLAQAVGGAGDAIAAGLHAIADALEARGA